MPPQTVHKTLTPPAPAPVTTGFTWEQKQEQDVGWQDHGGLGAGRDLSKGFGPEKS